MGLSDQEISIKITLDSDGAVKGIQQLGEQVEGIKEGAESAGGGFSKFQAGLLTVNAAIGVASAAFGVLKGAFNSVIDIAERGDAFNDLSDAFNRLTQEAGASADVLLNDLQKATSGAISNIDLMTIANQGLIKGLDPSIFDDVAQAAVRYANATGQDAKQSLDKFVNAIALGNEKQLKQLGIFKDGKIVIDKYSDSLTAQIQSQKGVGDKVGDLGVKFANLTDHVASAIDQNRTLSEIFTTILTVVDDFVLAFQKLIDKFLNFIDTNQRVQKELNNLGLGFKALGKFALQIADGEMPSLSKAAEEVYNEMQKTTNGTEQLAVTVTAARTPVEKLTLALKDHEKAIKAIDYREIFGPGNTEGISEFIAQTNTGTDLVLNEFQRLGIEAAAIFTQAFASESTLHGRDYVNIGAQISGSIANSLLPGSGPIVETIVDKIWTQFLGERDAQGQARDDADKFFADLFDANRLSVVVNGQLKQINDLVFGRGTDIFSSGTFDDFLSTLSGPVQEGFLGVGRAFNELLGNADNLGGQLAAIFANNVGGSLNNLQLLVQSTGKSFEELGSAVEKAFLDGKLSALEAQSAFTGLQNTAQKGIPDAIGATIQAFQNLTAAGIQGGRASVDALQDLASEALELGFTTLPQLQQNLLASGKFTQESIAQLFEQLSSRGIDTLQELQELSNRTAIDVLAALGQSDFPFEQTAQRVEDLLNKIDQIPDDKEIHFKITTEFDQNSKTAIEKGFTPDVSIGPGFRER